MKAVAIVFVLLLAVCGAALYFGGVFTMDPSSGIEEFKQTAKPGTSWQTLVDVRAPRTWYSLDFSSDRGRSPEVKYDEAKIKDGVSKGSFRDGFVFMYQFTADEAFEVRFDSSGNLQSVSDVMTANDLFQGKAFKQ